MKKKLFLFFMITSFSLLFSQTNTYIQGTFLLPEDFSTTTQRDALLAEFDNMDIKTIIIKSMGKIESDLTVTWDVQYSNLEALLDKIDSDYPNIDVYVGLFDIDTSIYWNSGNPWNTYKSSIIQTTSYLIDGIHQRLDANNCFKGFYLTPEIDFRSHNINNANEYFKPVIHYIKSFSSSPNTAIGGGYVKAFINGTNQISPSGLKNKVSDFIDGNDSPDIFLLQDGVGSFENPIENAISGFDVNEYLSKAKEGIGSNGKMWVVVELFSIRSGKHIGKYWRGLGSITRIGKQIELAKLYSNDNMVISWLNSSHMTENHHWDFTPQVEGAKHLYRGYMANYYNEGNYYDNVSYSYTELQPSTNPNYQDILGNELTDNKIGQLNGKWIYYNEWVGFLKGTQSDNIVIEVDLNQTGPISNVSVIALSQKTMSIRYPIEIEVEVWNGNSWQTLGTMIKDFWQDVPTDFELNQLLGTFMVQSDTSIQGSKVKIEITPRNQWSWVFVSEIEIFGIPTSANKTSSPQANDEVMNQLKYSLLQNYPNPFNPVTKIKYSIPVTSNVTLSIFDLLGREVSILVNEEKEKGNYEVDFNGTNIPSGIYFYKLQAGQFTEIKKLVMLK